MGKMEEQEDRKTAEEVKGEAPFVESGDCDGGLNIVGEFEIDMNEIMSSSLNDYTPGTIIEGKVVEILPTKIVVDIGMKAEGIIEREELPSDFKVSVGDTIPVVLESRETVDGHPMVSWRRAYQMRIWQNLAKAYAEGLPVEGKVLQRVNGGFIIDIGKMAFLPISQVVVKKKQMVDDIIGQTIKVKIVEFDKKRRHIVVSQKLYHEEEQKLEREAIKKKLEVGAIVEGKVSNITPYGAFVDLGGGFSGLIYITDLSWTKVDKVSDVVNVGDTVKVKITKIDWENNHISLSLKETQPDPWAEIENKHPVGSKTVGKIVAITDFGIFVRLNDGIDGLVHASEVCWFGDYKEIKGNYKVGDDVEVVVLKINKEKRHLSLSIKRLSTNPYEKLREKYPPGTKVSGVVTDLVPFGAFVKLSSEDVEGLIHIGDFSWTKTIKHPREMLSIGDKIEVVVLDIKPEEEKIILGLKQLKENPFVKYSVGKVVDCKVRKIMSSGVIVELEPEVEGIIRTSELSLEKVDDPAKVVKIGEWIKAKVISSSEEEKKILLSVRQYEKDLEKEELKKYITSTDGSEVPLGEVIKDKNKEK